MTYDELNMLLDLMRHASDEERRAIFAELLATGCIAPQYWQNYMGPQCQCWNDE